MDYNTGRFFGRLDATREAQNNIAHWQQYAAELEQQIADLSAKVAASRETIDECVGQIQNLNPQSPWSNRESVRELTKSLYQKHMNK